MTEDTYYTSNDYLCDIHNDYVQSLQECGPDDHLEWEDYVERRIASAKEYDIYLVEQHSILETEDELPF
jgi:hypothetical protein